MEITNKDVPLLESLCDECNGEGGSYDQYVSRWIDCPNCGGAGFIPTSFGKQILELMQHNFRPMLKCVQGKKE
jgi:DnaJ-class molecular chaperone